MNFRKGIDLVSHGPGPFARVDAWRVSRIGSSQSTSSMLENDAGCALILDIAWLDTCVGSHAH